MTQATHPSPPTRSSGSHAPSRQRAPRQAGVSTQTSLPSEGISTQSPFLLEPRQAYQSGPHHPSSVGYPGLRSDPAAWASRVTRPATGSTAAAHDPREQPQQLAPIASSHEQPSSRSQGGRPRRPPNKPKAGETEKEMRKREQERKKEYRDRKKANATPWEQVNVG